MLRILYVISTLRYGGTARQLTLLAAGLPPDTFDCRVMVLGPGGPWADTLRAAGVSVEVVGWTRPLDLPALSRLWRVARHSKADVVHVWGLSALRASSVIGGVKRARLIVSGLPRRRWESRMSMWDNWLVSKADWVSVSSRGELEHAHRLGVPESRLTCVHPAVTAVHTHHNSPTDSRLERGPTILGIGPLDRHKGFRDAVWVVDILRYLYPRLELKLVGSGADRPRIEQFARDAGVADRLCLLGELSEVTQELAEADLVWSLGREDGGANAILEAMAAGKPVVATRRPTASEIIVDGKSGLLVTPGDHAALAYQTRRLLDDPGLRQRLGEAGQQSAVEEFSVARMVARFTALYESRR